MRLLLAQDSDGHTTGYHVVARGLRDAGIEVVLAGTLLPRQIAELAVEEAADAIGYRIMDAFPVLLVDRLMRELQRVDLAGIPVVVGGIVQDEDLPRLAALGVARVFRPGTPMAEIADFFRALST